MKYYLLGYAHSMGYGNMFFYSKKHLDIREAERQIAKDINVDSVSVMVINKINKKQFVGRKDK